MAWLWESWDEYVKWCSPSGIQRGTFNLSRSSTELDSLKVLLDSFEELINETNELREMGFSRERKLPEPSAALIDKAWNHVISVVYAGETLLLYHKRLALTDSAYGFLHQNSIIDHWDRYAESKRVLSEIRRLVEDVDRLTDGYRRLQGEDERLLLHDLDLPNELEQDFRIARNLFSIGIDDIALFVAARGMETVLREIARDRKITLETKGRIEPVSESDLHDLIETMSRLRWKVKRTLILSKETRSLLQYVRTVRNVAAHGEQQEDGGSENFRQKASIIARTANRLWNAVAESRARLEETKIQKSW